MLEILVLVISIVSIVCWVIILIDAFKDEVWKGLVGLLCGLYLLYYAIFEFEHDNKILLIIGAFGGGAVAAGIARLGGFGS